MSEREQGRLLFKESDRSLYQRVRLRKRFGTFIFILLIFFGMLFSVTTSSLYFRYPEKGPLFFLGIGIAFGILMICLAFFFYFAISKETEAYLPYKFFERGIHDGYEFYAYADVRYVKRRRSMFLGSYYEVRMTSGLILQIPDVDDALEFLLPGLIES